MLVVPENGLELESGYDASAEYEIFLRTIRSRLLDKVVKLYLQSLKPH